jgi:hypothetical protein
MKPFEVLWVGGEQGKIFCDRGSAIMRSTILRRGLRSLEITAADNPSVDPGCFGVEGTVGRLADLGNGRLFSS